MSDDTTPSGWSPSAPPPPDPGGERSGFCQDCGTPLTPATAHHVGSAVFCEPCLTSRVEATTSAHATVPPQAASVADEPRPALAAVLGFIPGVGAMYNGQFAKGIVHLIIFAILVSLSDNVNGVFGIFVAGWIFYMAFEAYHTAVARRDSLPLPNAFGFNDIGERMGFGRAFSATPPSNPSQTPGQAPAPSQTPPQTPTQPPYSSPVPNATATYAPASSVPIGTAPDWVGYVPPTAFAAAAPADPAASIAGQAPNQAPSQIPSAAQAQAHRSTGYHAPYTETYTGAPATPYADSGLAPETASGRFPTGALWLIGLGVLILLGNLLPDWHLTRRWWPPALFAALALWTFTRRRSGVRTVSTLRAPVLLLVLAVMLALHAAYLAVTVALTAAVLLIAFGVLLLLERTLGATPAYAPPYAADPASFDPQAADTPSRTSWPPAETAAPKPEAPPAPDSPGDGVA